MASVLRRNRLARRGTFGTLVTLVLLITSLVTEIGAPGLAHQPMVTGEVVCVDGSWEISWTLTNSETTTGTNRSMSIDTLTITQGSVTGFAEGDVVPPQDPDVPGSGTVSGTTTLPGSASGDVTLTVVADWDGGGPQDVTSDPPGTVTLEGTCVTPSEPGASIADADCALSGAEITFTNTGGETATFEVLKNDVAEDTVAVTPAESPKTVLYSLNEGETATFKVTSEGMQDVVKTVTLDCIESAASIADADCAEGGAEITFTNNGTDAATFQVFRNDVLEDTVIVTPATSPETILYSLSENETATFKVTSADMEDVVRTVTLNCIVSVASISDAQCAEGGVEITFTNDGNDTATFQVFKNNVFEDAVTVTPAESPKTVLYSLNENETATFKVTSPDMEDVVKTVTFDCLTPPGPGASIADADCADGGVEITFTNSGEETATFEVFKNDVSVETVTVTPEESPKTVLYLLNENETATFKVTALDMEDGVRTITLDCVKPAATITLECVSPFGAKVDVSNTGTLPGTFVVTKNGTQIDSFSVAGGATVSKKYGMADDETATFAVTGFGLNESKAITNNCLDILGLRQKQAPPAAAAAAVLPATGIHFLEMLLAAFTLIGVGRVLIRRREVLTL